MLDFVQVYGVRGPDQLALQVYKIRTGYLHFWNSATGSRATRMC